MVASYRSFWSLEPLDGGSSPGSRPQPSHRNVSNVGFSGRTSENVDRIRPDNDREYDRGARLCLREDAAEVRLVRSDATVWLDGW
jgi:hypothetical protein